MTDATPVTHWVCGRTRLDLTSPRVMGVVNVTPDSFFDGGHHFDPERALDHARRLRAEGADIIDVGGESTRPGAMPVPPDVELARVLPVVAALAEEGVLVSIDTTKPEVMREAVTAGAAIVNDVRALCAADAVATVARTGAGVCLMHMRGEPRTMQEDPVYGDVVRTVRDFLSARAAECEAMGIVRERIVIDPGIGFGKTVAHNLALLRRLGDLATTGYPVLVGVSRKSTLGALSGQPPADRLPASIAGALAAIARGARIVRVHDVRATVDALRVWRAVGGSVT